MCLTGQWASAFQGGLMLRATLGRAILLDDREVGGVCESSEWLLRDIGVTTIHSFNSSGKAVVV